MLFWDNLNLKNKYLSKMFFSITRTTFSHSIGQNNFGYSIQLRRFKAYNKIKKKLFLPNICADSNPEGGGAFVLEESS